MYTCTNFHVEQSKVTSCVAIQSIQLYNHHTRQVNYVYQHHTVPSHFISSHFVNSHLSTLTKWKLTKTKWELTKWELLM